MESIPWRLAIDFGTSNTAATVVAQGRGDVHVLRLGTRSDAMPSCVAAYNEEIYTGDAALQIAGIYPSAFEPTPKRRLGEDAVVLGGKMFDPVDLVAAVLRFVVNQAIRFVGGGQPAQVVLTHPEAWDEYMKHRLRAAADKAGLPAHSIVLLPEPVAAVWHYAASSELAPGAHVAVLDFGGGTCDAAVLEFAQTTSGPTFHVVSSGGIDPLGGHDFDAQLENWVYAQLAAEGKDVLLQNLKSGGASAEKAVLRDQIREAKHALSFHGSAPIGVRSGPDEWVCTVTRREFEQLIERQLDRTVQLVQQVIHDALPSVQHLHKVYLTGGSSYIPALQRKLGEILPMKLGLMGDPKQITSIGALQAPAWRGQAPGTGSKPQAVFQGAGTNGGQTSRSTRQPNDIRPSTPPNGRKPDRVSKKVLIGGGVAAVVALLGTAIAVGSNFPPPEPPPTSTSAGTTSEAPPPPRTCAGEERPGLSDGECTLLAIAAELRIVDPDTCTASSALFDASYGFDCRLPSNSGFTPAENATISVSVFSYTSVSTLNTEFDRIIDEYGAANRSPDTPPGWQTWGDQRGRVMGAIKDGANYVAWTDEELLLEIWAKSTAVDVPRLVQWWEKTGI